MRLGFRQKLLALLLTSAFVFLGLGSVGALWLASLRAQVIALETEGKQANDLLRVLAQARQLEERVRSQQGPTEEWSAQARRVTSDLTALQRAGETTDERAAVGQVVAAWATVERALAASPEDGENVREAFASFWASAAAVASGSEPGGAGRGWSIASQLSALQLMAMACAGLALVILVGWFWSLRPPLRTIGELATTAERLARSEISELERALGQLAAGDLTGTVTVRTEPLPIRGADEFAQMASAFNQMLERIRAVSISYTSTVSDLSEALVRVREAATRVSASGEATEALSSEVARLAEELSQVAERVAAGSVAQAEQIRGSSRAIDESERSARRVVEVAVEQARELRAATQVIEVTENAARRVHELSLEVTGRARENSTRATEGSALVERATELSRSVQEQMVTTRRTITALVEHVQAIGQFVEVIQGLARQTTFLALNAAIEAARAGEAGKRVRGRGQRGAEAGGLLWRGGQAGDRDRGADRGDRRGGSVCPGRGGCCRCGRGARDRACGRVLRRDSDGSGGDRGGECAAAGRAGGAAPAVAVGAADTRAHRAAGR
jgi:methyl-accepting chemotaxis protein